MGNLGERHMAHSALPWPNVLFCWCPPKKLGLLLGCSAEQQNKTTYREGKFCPGKITLGKFCPKFRDSIFSLFLSLGTEFLPPFLRKGDFPIHTKIFLRRFTPYMCEYILGGQVIYETICVWLGLHCLSIFYDGQIFFKESQSHLTKITLANNKY